MKSPSDDFFVQVSDPTKIGDGINSYIAYNVVSNVSRTGFESGNVVVSRRFSDFVWLTEEFCRLYPGVIVPNLPDKKVIGKFTSEFIEGRRRALEKFLGRIACHQDLGTSSTFSLFLQAGEPAFTNAKEATKIYKIKLTDKASSWLTASANSLKAITTSKHPPELEKTDIDIVVDDIEAYTTIIGNQLEIVHKYSENLVRKSMDSSNTIQNFARSLSELGLTEAEDLSRTLRQIGEAMEKFSVEAKQHSSMQLLELEEPFEEYVRFVGSVKAALGRRSEKESQYRTAILDFKRKEQAYNNIMSSSGKEKDAAAKKEAFELSQTVLQSVKTEFDSISNKLIAEFQYFKQQKAKDFRNIIFNFATIEAEFNQREQQFWSLIIPSLKALNGGPKGDITHVSCTATTVYHHEYHLNDNVSLFLDPTSHTAHSIIPSNAPPPPPIEESTVPEYEEI